MSDAPQPRRAVIRVDFKDCCQFAREIGVPSEQIGDLVTKQFEDVISTFARMNPDDFLILDKDALRTVTINDRVYQVEIFDAVGIECPHCHASLFPLSHIPQEQI